LDPILNPIILYAGLALGAIGVVVAMPKRGVNPQILGALLAGIGVGAILIALAVVGAQRGDGPANLFFYIFSLISLGGAMRVITHPRPVYAALYFILTVISTAGLFLLLSAEFMTFALVIIYAGAILITYLFVIMLATQAPTEEAIDALNEYDAHSREPILSTIVGFALLAALVGMLGYGVPALKPPTNTNPNLALDRMPGRVQSILEEIGIADDVMPAASSTQMPRAASRNAPNEERAQAQGAIMDWRRAHSGYRVSANRNAEHVGNMVLTLRDADAFQQRLSAALAIEQGDTPTGALAQVTPLSPEALGLLVFPMIQPEPGRGFSIAMMWLPDRAAPENLETVGLALVGEHPLSLELAGVILLMAMLGAVILSRKQTEIDLERKAAHAKRLAIGAAGGSA